MNGRDPHDERILHDERIMKGQVNVNDNSNERDLKKSYLLYVSFTESARTFKGYPILRRLYELVLDTNVSLRISGGKLR